MKMRSLQGTLSVSILLAVISIISPAKASRTINATSGNDTIYFGVVNDGGTRKLAVLTRTGSGTLSTGVFNMDNGRLTINALGGNDRIEAISEENKEGVSFINIVHLTYTEIYLDGGAGNDEIWGTPGSDNLYGGSGIDMLVGKEGADVLNGGSGDDYLWGWPDNDVLLGGSGNDFLLGDQGDDTLDGGPNDDILVGGVHDDVIDGGGGYDRFWCRTVASPNPYAVWDDLAETDCGDTVPPVNIERTEKINPYNHWAYMFAHGNEVTCFHRTTSNPRQLIADRAAGAQILMAGGGDRPITGDFDRDGRCDDVAVFRPTNQRWFFDYNHDGDTDSTSTWAEPGDIPVAGDFDRDGRLDDVGVYCPSSRMWFFDYNHNGTMDSHSGPWGNPGDIPIAGNFDTDGRCDDVAVFRPGNRMWYLDLNHNGTTDAKYGPWGLAGDIPLAGDFDRDGRNDDVALFRPSTGRWYYDYNHNGNTDSSSGGTWGGHGDIPLAGDFDRDGRYDDVGLFRMREVNWYYDYNANNTTDDKIGPWGYVGEPLHATHKQYGNSCGPTSMNMVFEYLGKTNPGLRRWFRRDLSNTSANPVPSAWWPDNAVDVGYHLSMEHIMWEWFHEKRQRDPGWTEGGNFMSAGHWLNTDDAAGDTGRGRHYEIEYDMGNVNWNPTLGTSTGRLQKWLKHCPGVGWSDFNQNKGLPWVANKYSDGLNDARPIPTTIGSGGTFKSLTHLKAVIKGFINNNIPVVVAVENGGHFNTLIGYWELNSTFYIYTAEPLDGWGRPFYSKPMRWRRMELKQDMLGTGTGTLVGIMPYGHAIRQGVGADWAEDLDDTFQSDVLCGYLR